MLQRSETSAFDLKEQMIVIFMGQLHPAGALTLAHQLNKLAYQVIVDSGWMQ
jgi:hypothetical protein